MKKTLVTIKDFKGYYDFPDTRVPEEGFVNASNVSLTNQGSFVIRQGAGYWGSLTYTNCVPLDVWYLSSGTTYLVLDVNGGASTKFVIIPGATETYSASVITDLVLQYNDLAYLFKTNGAFSTFSGAGTLVTMGFTVAGTVGIVHKSRMFVCDNNTTANKATVKYSDLFTVNAPNTAGGWPANNFVDIQSSDGDPVTAMIILNDTLIIFKSTSTWALYTEGEPPWTLRLLHATIGCIGRNTPTVIGGMVYFVSQFGTIRTDGTTFENISLNLLHPTSYATVLQMNEYSAVEFKGKYIHNVPTFAQVYNIEKDVWTTWNIPNETTVGRLALTKTASVPIFYFWLFGTSLRGLYYQELALSSVPEWSDKNGGASYPITLTGKMTDFEMPNEIKLVKQVSLSFTTKITSTVTVSVTYLLDGGTSVGPYTAVLPASSDVIRTDLNFRGPMKCYDSQIKIEFTPQGYMELNAITYDIVTPGKE